MTLADRVLAAIRAGATTSPAVAEVLGISRGVAKVIVHNLRVAGALRWTGQMVVREAPGRRARVYEAA